MNSDGRKKGICSESKRTGKIMIVLSMILGILIAIYLGISVYAAYTITKIGDHEQYGNTPGTFGIEYEDVRFKARYDGIEIAAWYIPNEVSSQAIILVHGHAASKQNAISGNFPKLGAELQKAGFTVLMIDMRGHGDSQSARNSFGVYERRDVLGAVDWLAEKGYEPGEIGVLGISMGGAAAIGAVYEEPGIAALLVESTFSDVNPVIKTKWSEKSGLPDFFIPGVALMIRLLYGYNVFSIKPVNEFEAFNKQQLLVIHCVEDTTFPPWHAEQLHAAAPHAETWITDGCEHAEIYRDYPDEYESVVINFFKRNLK